MPSLDVSMIPPRATLMLGDLHGTREIPAFVGRVARALAARERVVVALEAPQEAGPGIAAYLASDGSAPRRAELVAGAWWQYEYQDGRRSVALVELLDALRGTTIDVVVIDEQNGKTPDDREQAMASHVIAARRAHPDAAMVVYAGNLHVRRREAAFRPGFPWMAMRVEAAGIPVMSLDVRYEDGTAWICQGSDTSSCGVAYAAGRGGAPGIQLAPTKDGAFDGTFGVGPVTASPPAGKPVGDLDQQIAAAAASPQAVRAKARRAYDAKQFGRCADLLATVAAPDGGIAYDHACCLALAGKKDEALARLTYAIGAGFSDLEHIEQDEDLASLRDDPRWPIKK